MIDDSAQHIARISYGKGSCFAADICKIVEVLPNA